MKLTCKGHIYDVQDAQMHSFCGQFLVLMSAGILGKWHPIIWSCISLWVFSYNFLRCFENNFLEHLYTVEKDSTVITRDSFKNYILACEISNQMHTNLEKRKVPPAFSGNIVQKWCSAQNFVLYLWLKFLKNTFKVVYT